MIIDKKCDIKTTNTIILLGSRKRRGNIKNTKRKVRKIQIRKRVGKVLIFSG